MDRKAAHAIAAAAAALVLASCGGSVVGSPEKIGSASTSGQVAGMPAPTGDVVAAVFHLGPADTGPTAEIALTNLSDACGVLESVTEDGGIPGDIAALAMVLFAPSEAPAVGTYPVSGAPGCAPNCPGGYIEASYSVTDAQCIEVRLEPASSGSVVLTKATSEVLQGSFDLTFGSGDRVSGTFNAPICALRAPVLGPRSCL